jgi:hypothetical protein
LIRYTISRDGLSIPSTLLVRKYLPMLAVRVLEMGAVQVPIKKRKIQLFTRSTEILLARQLMEIQIHYAFVASPEMVTALAISGDLGF